MKFSWILVMLLIAFVAVFSVQNADVVTVRFLLWQFSLSTALVIQLAALIGALVGLVIGALSGRESRKAARLARSAAGDDQPRLREREITRTTVGTSDPAARESTDKNVGITPR